MIHRPSLNVLEAHRQSLQARLDSLVLEAAQTQVNQREVVREIDQVDATLRTLHLADAAAMMSGHEKHAPHIPADAPAPDVHAPNVAEPVPAPRHSPGVPDHAQEEVTIPAKRQVPDQAPTEPKRKAPEPARKAPEPARKAPGKAKAEDKPGKRPAKQKTAAPSLTVNGKRRGRPPGSKNKVAAAAAAAAAPAPARRGPPRKHAEDNAAVVKAKAAEYARKRRLAAKAGDASPKAPTKRGRPPKAAASTIMPDPSQLPVSVPAETRDVTL